MVFTTTNLFKGISCPKGDVCRLTHCIYSHNDASQTTQTTLATEAASKVREMPPQPSKRGPHSPAEPVSKRRKVAYESEEAKSPTRADRMKSQLAQLKAQSQSAKTPPSDCGESQDATLKRPPSLTRPVSPPGSSAQKPSIPTKKASNGSSSSLTSKPVTKPVTKKVESLNPRMIPKDPAGHNKRSLFLKYLHEAMGVLNTQVENSTMSPERVRVLYLSQQDLVKLALDEEERFAREQGPVYANVIKNRIAAYKKMKLDDWVEHLKSTFADPEAKKKQSKAIDTGLTPAEELLVLPRLAANQKPLTRHGYIIEPPSEEDVDKAIAAMETSQHYELCDRCGTRFQALPERNEDGLLSTNGPCKYHFAKRVFPNRTRADPVHKEPYYPCCNESVGTLGCTTHESHVFKPSHPARLAAVTPFINTPDNDKPSTTKSGHSVGAVTFDCEMGYTSLGFELLRLTAVSWPLGEELIDVLVRPRGTIVDLNSRYSGIWPEHWTNAILYEQHNDIQSATTKSTYKDAAAPPTLLPMISSPKAARDLLCSYLTPATPLLGHGLENDLNAVRLCHPTIVDTILLYPHPKGLPLRFGLKKLSAQYLKRDIQMGGDRGHDSLEDARATGDLARVRVGEVWRSLKGQGWKIEGGALVSSASEVNRAVENKKEEIKEAERVVGAKGVGREVESGSDEEVEEADDAEAGSA